MLFFEMVSGQWRMGSNGPVALDYGVIWTTIEKRRIPEDEQWDFFDDIRTMEAAALKTMRQGK